MFTSGLGASAARLAVSVEVANGKCPASAFNLAILGCCPHYKVDGEEVCECTKQDYRLHLGKLTSDQLPARETQAVWFSMLETVFSLIAINLPCLGWLIPRVPVESAPLYAVCLSSEVGHPTPRLIDMLDMKVSPPSTNLLSAVARTLNLCHKD